MVFPPLPRSSKFLKKVAEEENENGKHKPVPAPKVGTDGKKIATHKVDESTHKKSPAEEQIKAKVRERFQPPAGLNLTDDDKLFYAFRAAYMSPCQFAHDSSGKGHHAVGARWTNATKAREFCAKCHDFFFSLDAKNGTCKSRFAGVWWGFMIFLSVIIVLVLPVAIAFLCSVFCCRRNGNKAIQSRAARYSSRFLVKTREEDGDNYSIGDIFCADLHSDDSTGGAALTLFFDAIRANMIYSITLFVLWIVFLILHKDAGTVGKLPMKSRAQLCYSVMLGRAEKNKLINAKTLFVCIVAILHMIYVYCIVIPSHRVKARLLVLRYYSYKRRRLFIY